jgi:hypothetical protein
MRRLVTNRDIDSMDRTTRSIREAMGRTHLFYVLLEETNAAQHNPIDPIFGEPVDPFDTSGLTIDTTRIGFVAYVPEENTTSVYQGPGFFTSQHIRFEVGLETKWRQKIDWKPGTLIIADGVRYRVTNVSPSGFFRANKLILEAEKVN